MTSEIYLAIQVLREHTSNLIIRIIDLERDLDLSVDLNVIAVNEYSQP
jgi:hypothetical protein